MKVMVTCLADGGICCASWYEALCSSGGVEEISGPHGTGLLSCAKADDVSRSRRKRVTPAKAGVPRAAKRIDPPDARWVPAFAGTTLLFMATSFYRFAVTDCRPGR